MAYVGRKGGASDDAAGFEQVACVTAICVLASVPLAFCVALTVWGA